MISVVVRLLFTGGVEPETADTTPPTIDAASLEISKKNITPGETVSIKNKGGR